MLELGIAQRWAKMTGARTGLATRGGWHLIPRFAPLIITLPSVVIIWIAVLWYQQNETAQAQRHAQTNASILARALEEEFLRTIDSIDQTLKYVRDSYVRNPKEFDLHAWQQSGRFLSQIAFQIGITDENGMLRSTNLGSNTPINLSDREHVRIHFSSTKDQLFISKPVLGRVSKKWSIQLSRRMEFPDGALAGVVVASLDPDQISVLHSGVALGDFGSITIFGDDGIVRSRTPAAANSVGFDLSKTPTWFHHSQNNAGSYSFMASSAIDGTRRLFTARRIRGTTLRIVIGQAVDTIQESADHRLKWVYGSGAALTIWLLVSMILMLRYQRGLAQSRDASEAGIRSKSEFLATMSHEIRTPLNGVIGLADILTSTPLDRDQAKLVETLKVSAAHLLELLNDILDLSRLDANKLTLERTNFSMGDVAEAVIELLRASAASKGIRLDCDIAPSVLPAYIGDPARIRQILFNLIGNAIKSPKVVSRAL